MNRLRIALLLLVIVVPLSGCKPDDAVKKGQVIGRGTVPISSPAPDAGTIRGMVRIHGPLPAPVKIDMSMDPACSVSAGDNFAEQFVGNSGKLANVYLYIKSGAPSSQTSGSRMVILDQKGCRYTPHVIALQQGASVEFRNSDPTMHNVHTAPSTSGNAAIDVSQGPSGQPQIRQFTKPETMLPVRCNNHPWMNAFINVAPNPYFAVSANDGSFIINGLPAGNYTLAAVHETLGEQDFQVNVTANATATADITFTHP